MSIGHPAPDRKGGGFRSLDEEHDEGDDRKEHLMCLTCGCMQAHLEMGEHNIRYEDVKAAADENGRSVAETIDIIDRTWAVDREDSPRGVPGGLTQGSP